VTVSASARPLPRRGGTVKPALQPVALTIHVAGVLAPDELQKPQQPGLNLWGCKLYAGVAGVCCICGSGLPKRRRSWCSQACIDNYQRNHGWATAALWVKLYAGRTCVRCGSGGRLEANHIVPVNGGSRDGCVSHQDNLEALCHDCHQAATATQRREGLIGAL
jgi:5-methylcytosine-specific restriction endonuclease McrA